MNPRGISGIFFRYKEGDRYVNRAFEDIPESEQDRILSDKEPEFVRNLAKMLADKLRSIGDQFGIEVYYGDDG